MHKLFICICCMRRICVCDVVVVGLFEEEEEETGVTSDIFKVEGEDPNTLDYLRGDRVRLILGRGCVSVGSLTMKPRDRT